MSRVLVGRKGCSKFAWFNAFRFALPCHKREGFIVLVRHFERVSPFSPKCLICQIVPGFHIKQRKNPPYTQNLKLLRVGVSKLAWDEGFPEQKTKLKSPKTVRQTDRGSVVKSCIFKKPQRNENELQDLLLFRGEQEHDESGRKRGASLLHGLDRE
jgi:hypothetical protein